MTRKGLETVYFDVDQQDRWGKRFSYYERIPYNTDGRRVFGYMRALEEDCRVMLAIDDDNFPTNDDFIARHMVSGQRWSQPVLEEARSFTISANTWIFSRSARSSPAAFRFACAGT